MSDVDVLAIINRQSGTLKTADADSIGALIVSCFAEAGKTAQCRFYQAGEFARFLEQSIVSTDAGTILVAGGDGTVSTAASLCIDNDRILGVLPAGTMNLYARTLNVPLDLEAAVRALAKGKTMRCDIGVANGRRFVHQYSVGLQPKIIQERDRASHRSRFNKLLAGLRATVSVVRRPPTFKVRIDKDGAKQEQKLSFIAVSNNLYGEGHLPYADKVDGGVLGMYWAGRLGPRENLKLIADLTLGNWSANPNFVAALAQKKVILEFPNRKRSSKAVIDGELIPVENRVEIGCQPRCHCYARSSVVVRRDRVILCR